MLFLNTRNDVLEILNACDIGVLCSHQEGFSNSVLEGMASGLPMIVTDVGGNAEAVLNGKSGIVVPPHDSAPLPVHPRLRARQSWCRSDCSSRQQAHSRSGISPACWGQGRDHSRVRSADLQRS